MVVKSQLEKQLTAKLGRTAHVGKVEFSPWSLEATIHELAIDQAINSEAPDFIPKQTGLTKLRDTGIATLNIFKEIT